MFYNQERVLWWTWCIHHSLQQRLVQGQPCLSNDATHSSPFCFSDQILKWWAMFLASLKGDSWVIWGFKESSWGFVRFKHICYVSTYCSHGFVLILNLTRDILGWVASESFWCNSRNVCFSDVTRCSRLNLHICCIRPSSKKAWFL